MVKLIITPAAKAAIEEYCRVKRVGKGHYNGENAARLATLSNAQLGSPVDHHELVDISKHLLQYCRDKESRGLEKQYRLDTLLKGAAVYQPPSPPKPEPTREYKLLMQSLREQEEKRQYERMLTGVPQTETSKQSFPNASAAFSPATSHGQGPQVEEPDDVTYADINRQMILIINVLISIIACSVTIWFAARRWDVPQRLGLSMSGSSIVAVAEVAIYAGYIKRIRDAKEKEMKKVEKREITEVWVVEKTPSTSALEPDNSTRFRKGKHR